MTPRLRARIFPGGGARAAVAALALLPIALCGSLAAQGASPAMLAAGLLAIGLVLLALARPSIAAVLLLAVIALVPHDRLEALAVPVGPFGLMPTDLLLGLAVGAGFLRILAFPDTPLPPASMQVMLLLLALLVCASLLTATGHGTPLNQSFIELRGLMPYALVIPIAAERDPRVLERIVLLFILLAGVASVLALADFAATGGNAIDQAGQPENRVLGDAFLLPTLGLVFLLARWLVGARPVVLRRGAVVPLAVLMAAALLVTFQRGAWLALLGGLAVVVILAGRGRRRRRLAGGVLAVIALVSALALVGAAGGSQHGIVHAATDRFASISDEQNVSNKHRLVEWQTAIQGIERHPAWGIGVGSTITFWSPLYSDVTKRMGGTYVTYYLHNSYIWTALKLGVAGLLALLGLIATGVVTAVRTLARSSDVTVRGLLVGAVGAIACFLVLAMTGPHLTIDRSACFLAAVLGLIAALAGTGDRSPGSGLR